MRELGIVLNTNQATPKRLTDDTVAASDSQYNDVDCAGCKRNCTPIWAGREGGDFDIRRREYVRVSGIHRPPTRTSGDVTWCAWIAESERDLCSR
jgi:hypothetical protein